jgi:hypothetical protein
VIVSYRDKWTRDFAAGKRVKAFSASSALPGSSSIGWKQLSSLGISVRYPAIDLKP